jgi:hypothetical protein
MRIITQTALPPVNLGDQPHVLVVTACKNCKGDSPELWEQAHYSEEGLVHVAAPGATAVPGLGTTEAYVEMHGTSQAAAFVAGVAARMAACYPDAYRIGGDLKARLQITARPIVAERDARRIATGVVDYGLAMLDPERTYLLQGERYMAIDNWEWCTDELDLQHKDGRELPLNNPHTGDIHRITRVKTQDRGWAWVLYRRDRANPTPGRVLKIGPFHRLRGNMNVLKRDGEAIGLSQIKDLILSKPHNRVDAKGCQ